MNYTIINAIYSFVAFAFAISFHEWAHAFAAYRLGDPTARNAGRMTLNPFKHIDLFGTLMLLVFGFGWAKPVPVNPRNYKNLIRDDIIVSLAGVLVNMLLAFVFMPLSLYLVQISLEQQSVVLSVLAAMVDYFVFINITLAIFNLIPVPPLDGSHVLEDLLIRKVGPKPFIWMRNNSRYLLIGVLIILRITGVLSLVTNSVYEGIASLYMPLLETIL